MFGRCIGCFKGFFVFCKLSCFLTGKREAKLRKQRPISGNPCFETGPPNLPQATIGTEKGPILGLGWGPEDQSYQATLQFALKRPDFCEVHDLRDSKALLRRRGFRACTQSMRSAGSVSESQDCESIFSTVPTTSQTVKQKSFRPREESTKRGKAKKLTRETVTLLLVPDHVQETVMEHQVQTENISPVQNVTGAKIAHVESRPQLHVSLEPEASPTFQLPSPSYVLVSSMVLMKFKHPDQCLHLLPLP